MLQRITPQTLPLTNHVKGEIARLQPLLDVGDAGVAPESSPSVNTTSARRGDEVAVTIRSTCDDRRQTFYWLPPDQFRMTFSWRGTEPSSRRIIRNRLPSGDTS